MENNNVIRIKVEERKEIDISNLPPEEQIKYIYKIGKEEVEKTTLYIIKVSKRVFGNDDYLYSLIISLRALSSLQDVLVADKFIDKDLVVILKKPLKQ